MSNPPLVLRVDLNSLRGESVESRFTQSSAPLSDTRREALVRLHAIDKAARLEAFSKPGFDFHRLRGSRPRRYSIHVKGRGASPSSGTPGGRCGSISNDIIQEQSIACRTSPTASKRR
jgi:plasmid maintenance system killer protein